MKELGVGELVYQGEVYDKMNAFSFDLEFYRSWCERGGGSVLELCCGTGRLTIPLKQAGIDIQGLDLCDTMLDRARRKADAAGVQIEFRKGDIREFDLGRRFRTVFIPFNSLQHTYSIRDLERVFANVKRHLEPRGQFLFDVFNPGIHLMVDRERSITEVSRFRLDDGREVVVREQCRFDPATQVNRVRWFFHMGSEETIQNLDMRCFFPLEMDALLKYNGFRIVSKFGSFDEAPFGSTSPKQIFVCQ